MKTLLTIKLFARLSLLGLALSAFNQAQAAEHCDDNYYIDKTFSNGARWDMCWTHSRSHGIRYHHIYYTPKNGTRRMVLRDAAVSQIHVPYDDNGARYHDVSDYGLGNSNLRDMSSEECQNGTLHRYGNKDAVCSKVTNKGAAYRVGSNTAKSEALKVSSISRVGAYVYIPQWLFYDDGRIEPSILATGSLQRFGNSSADQHGWLLADNGNVGLSHMHNYFWRLDFDLNGSAYNDVAQEINYASSGGQRQRSVTTFSTEVARSVSPSSQRSWIVRDDSQTNAKGHLMGYEIRLDEVGHREIGPSNERFTYNDFFVTRHKSCEQIASHNRRVNPCSADSLDQFANGESLNGKDLVAWVGVSFYHVPRSEDAPRMDIHSNHFQIIPRDWHDKNPLVTLAAEPLVANEDTATTSAGESVTVDVLANDSGTGISIDQLDDPSHGTAVITNGKVVYTPDAGFAGTEVFWYSIKDVTGAVYGTKITIEVTGTDSSAYPEANPDTATTAAGEPVSIDIFANDTGVGLTIIDINEYSYNGGRIVMSGNLAVYTPRSGYAGEDTFWYAFSDSQGRTNSTYVNVTVTGVDAGAYPTAGPDSVSTTKNTSATFDVLANDTGVGLTLSDTNPWSLRGGQVSIVDNKIVYTPKTDFVGEDKLWYEFADVIGRTNSGEVTITITDAAPPYPVAVADTPTTSRNTPVTFSPLENDIGVGLTILEVNEYAVNGGTIVQSGSQLTYTPETGYTGTDSFWYAIRDSLGRENAVEVTVTINP
ncbi:MAG: hypothetical protein CSB47_03820 [Proteobacteria bacterium]|nr:MAG: hypothetical protein CSB47_03820 [Pseudomonadota bacterium]